jgi:hypothetical protein
MTVPVGSTLARVYFTAPRDHDRGDPHDTRAAAVDDALDKWAAIAGDFPVYPPVVDERWVMNHPGDRGGRTDTLHQRSTVAPNLTEGDACRTQADRRALVARLRQATDTLSSHRVTRTT